MKVRLRILSFLLVAAFCTNFLPISAMATDTGVLASADAWDGSIAVGFAAGTGTAADPYQIATGAQLAYLASSVTSKNNYSGKYFLQTGDLILTGYEWTPIGVSGAPFAGNYNGGGHMITGLTLTRAAYDQRGLFGSMNQGGTIKNLTLKDATVCGKKNVGGILGYASGDSSGKNTVICNCHIQCSTVSGTENVGGIIGEIWWATVEKCTTASDVTVKGTTSVGGVIGYAVGDSWVSMCGNDAPVAGTENVGGVVGYVHQSPTVSQCYNQGAITGSKQVGGVCGQGYQSITISNCYNTGEVRGTSSYRYDYVGGISASSYSNYGSTSCCYNYGNVYKGDVLKNDLIIEDHLGSSMSSCYYLSQGAVSDGKGLTKTQMAKESSFTGFDFRSIWVMSPLVNRPLLRNLPESGLPNGHCRITVIDASTRQPIPDVPLAACTEEDIFAYTDDDGTAIFEGRGNLFFEDIPIFAVCRGYKKYSCYMSDLQYAASSVSTPDNYIYLEPDGAALDPDAMLVDEHVKFVENRYDRFTDYHSFNSRYWQFDGGDEMLAYRLWEAVGDVGEVLSLKVGDLTITADYYDLFLSEFILRMCDPDSNDFIEERVENAYKKAGETFLTEFVPLLIKTVNENTRLDLLLTEKEVEELNGESWETLLKWHDPSYVSKDIHTLLAGKLEDLPVPARLLYDTIFGELMYDDDFVRVAYTGIKDIDTVRDVCKDGIDAMKNISNAYVMVKGCDKVNEEVFDVLQKTGQYMEQDNLVYAMRFQEDLTHYRAMAKMHTFSFLHVFGESVENIAGFLWNNSRAKETVKKSMQQAVAAHLGVDYGAFSAAVKVYNGTYKLLNNVTRLDDKSDLYMTMNYSAPLEKAMIAAVKDYGKDLVSQQDMSRAAAFDCAYKCLREINLYLYENLYRYAVLFEGSRSNKVSSAAQSLMEMSMYMKNAWNRVSCHGNAVENRYKFTGVHCPVDVYLYNSGGDILVAIENEEITAYNDPSVTVMSCGGKKSLMYPADSDYSIRIIAREDGIMEYFAAEVDSVAAQRQVEFYDLPLSEGAVYTGDIPGAFDIDPSAYALTSDGVEYDCDYDSSSEAADQCEVSGHSWGEWIIEQEPAADSAGQKVRTCSICAKQERETLPKTGSTPQTVFVESWTVLNGTTRVELSGINSLPNGTVPIIFAASYSTFGAMMEITAGTIEENCVAFNEELSGGWTLFLLDEYYCPLHPPILWRERNDGVG